MLLQGRPALIRVCIYGFCLSRLESLKRKIGPSFKRGPPKGYIHAIEQRWHQVECILGSLMAIPQAQNVVSQLRADSFANSILDRVDSGPYGPRGRALERQGVTSGDFYATIMGAPEASRDDRRVRRQSRMTREIVSSENPSVLATPTKDWQDQLIRRLSGGQIPEYPISPIHTSASPASPSSSSYRGISEAIEPGRQRRRLEGSYVQDSSHLHQNVYEGGGGSDDSCTPKPPCVLCSVVMTWHLARF